MIPIIKNKYISFLTINDKIEPTIKNINAS